LTLKKECDKIEIGDWKKEQRAEDTLGRIVSRSFVSNKGSPIYQNFFRGTFSQGTFS
jgi:hypothetical protein